MKDDDKREFEMASNGAHGDAHKVLADMLETYVISASGDRVTLRAKVNIEPLARIWKQKAGMLGMSTNANAGIPAPGGSGSGGRGGASSVGGGAGIAMPSGQ